VNGDGDAAGQSLGGQSEPAKAAAEEILTDVVGLTAARDEYLAALQRTQADFANYRKRVLRQQEEQGSRAALDLVTKLLPVLDTLDLAVAHLDKSDAQDEPSTEGEALRQSRTLLIDTLAKEGLERVDAEGVPFDPSVHDAVAHAPNAGDEDGEPGSTIEEVLRSGYRWRGQTLRPAMVRVRG
jgi:molecular chaperone GrpE